MMLEQNEVCRHIPCSIFKKGYYCRGKLKNRGHTFLCTYVHRNVELIEEDISIWECPECGAITYTEIRGLLHSNSDLNFGLGRSSARVMLRLYECEGCSRIFGDPKKFNKRGGKRVNLRYLYDSVMECYIRAGYRSEEMDKVLEELGEGLSELSCDVRDRVLGATYLGKKLGEIKDSLS